MTLRDEITEKRREFWRDSDAAQTGEELERVIDRIDEMDNRINELESEVVNLNLRMDSVDRKLVHRIVPIKVSEN